MEPWHSSGHETGGMAQCCASVRSQAQILSTHVTPALGDRDRKNLGTHRPASLARMGSLRFSVRPGLEIDNNNDTLVAGAGEAAQCLRAQAAPLKNLIWFSSSTVACNCNTDPSQTPHPFLASDGNRHTWYMQAKYNKLDNLMGGCRDPYL